MKYTETGFRPLYHKYCIFPLSETIRDVVKEYPGYDYANGVLTYGYIDRETGFRLEIYIRIRIIIFFQIHRKMLERLFKLVLWPMKNICVWVI